MSSTDFESRSLGDILLVEDNMSHLKFLTEVLTEAGYRVRPASDGNLALRSLQAALPDLVLMDINLPGMNGVELCRQLKADSSTKNLPIIFISSHEETKLKVEALEAGGIDYMTKPIEPLEVLARISTHLKINQLQRKLEIQSEKLLKEIEERKILDRELVKYRDQLEYLVKERTAKLEKEIIERKQAEKALQVSERQLRLMIEKSPLPMVITNDNSDIEYYNNKFIELFGYTLDDISTAEKWWKTCYPDEEYRERVQNSWIKAIEKAQASNTDIEMQEWEWTIKDGSKRLCEFYMVPLKDFSLAIVNDITNRRNSERQLEWELTLNKTLAGLAGLLIDGKSSFGVMSELVHENAKTLTKSEHGFASVIDPISRDSIAFTLSKMMDKCNVTAGCKNVTFPISPEGTYTKLWGQALNTKKPFFTNEPQNHPASGGTPEGHIPIKNFLAAPAIISNNAIGEIALANKPSNYTEKDLNAVTQIANMYALAIDRKLAEDQIFANLKEKETLLQEVHHRVKNNMQVINSLLKLQSNNIEDSRAKEVLNDSQSRVFAMSAVHETLHESDKLYEIDLQSYITKITTVIFQTYSIGHGKVKLNSNVEDSPISINQAYPIGLIINELISNSLKHAFPNDMEGEINVNIEESEGDLELTVMDNGVGMPKDFDWKKSGNLGLKLVLTLVENQLDGSIDMENKNGTKFAIKFNVES